MSLFDHRQWAALDLSSEFGKSPPSIFLIFGDDFLVSQAIDHLMDFLVPPEERSLAEERFDGPEADVGSLLERINTYSFMGGARVFLLTDHPIFGASEHLAGLWKQLAAAQAKDNIQKGLSTLRHLLAISQVPLESLSSSNWSKQLKPPTGFTGDRSWLAARISTILEDTAPLPEVTSTADRIAEAARSGFPPGHFLVIATDAIDKRRRLYGRIKEDGAVVDCSLPKGARKADQTVRDATTATVLRETASRFGKSISSDAVKEITDRLGDDLHAMSTSVKTLAAFVGDRATISTSDVEAVVSRTRKDPVFALTNAVRAGDVPAALTYAGALMADGMHPLQIVAAIVNLVRRLRLARAFLDSPSGHQWHAGCRYREFTDRILPEIKRYDDQLFAEFEDDRHSQSLGAKVMADVRLSPKGGSPYPLFLLVGAAAEMTRAGLEDALLLIADRDVRLKSSKADARLEIECVIMDVCGRLRSRQP